MCIFQGSHTQPLLCQQIGPTFAEAPIPLPLQGAEVAFGRMAAVLGPALFTSLPKLQELLLAPLQQATTAQPQQLAEALQLLRILGPRLHPALLGSLQQLLPNMCRCLSHAGAGVSQAAAACLATLAEAHLEALMPEILR